jgi:cobyrinic acid a,c-diamide synthase
VIRLAIRGFVAGQVQFEEQLTLLNEQAIEDVVPDLAKQHGTALAAHELHMIEIEFLDEADPLQRFFRFGTDPSAMVAPVMVDLTKGTR